MAFEILVPPTRAPGSESIDSYTLDHQGIP